VFARQSRSAYRVEMDNEASGTAGKGLAAQFKANPTQVASLYDDWVASGYDADLVAWGYDAPRVAAGLVVEALSTRRSGDLGGPVLDAGCGTGLVGTELRRLGVDRITGGDFSPASVDTARSRGVYDEVVALDLNAPLDFADGRFRAVTSIGVFTYLTDSAATMSELLRIVEPSGFVVFTQRTDLWAERDFDLLVSSFVDAGRCAATVSAPSPYLPGHPEFGEHIGIRYTTLTKC
jgi:predicted TPR repeat methyltransferase